MLFSSGWQCVVNLPGGRSIQIADSRNRKTDAEDKANAVLIASAPDLLDERDCLKLQLSEAVALLRESREYAGVEWMVKTDNFLSKIEKPINEVCWCAAKVEAKDAVCPIHG
jgi:hypothetical protein